jgi:LysM repeat protein
MKRRVVLSLVVVGLLLAMGAQTASADDCPIHIVQPGENLYRLSLRYGTTVPAIASANGIVNVHWIYVGQQLVIPCETEPPVGTIYVVRYGDTLYGIARWFGTTVSAIASANGIANPDLIYAGQPLLIPGPGGTLPPEEPPRNPLADTSWQATAYFDGTTMQDVIEGTTVTADFAADGALRGSGGCNSYSTTYLADTRLLTVHPAAVTEMFCSAALNDQETAYLTALSMAAAYRLEAGHLYVEDIHGQVAAEFVSR